MTKRLVKNKAMDYLNLYEMDAPRHVGLARSKSPGLIELALTRRDAKMALIGCMIPKKRLPVANCLSVGENSVRQETEWREIKVQYVRVMEDEGSYLLRPAYFCT